jgi:prohibitin 2
MERLVGPSKLIASIGSVLAVGGAASYGIYNSLFTVDGGHRAVMFNRLTGVKGDVYGEGTHIMIPWFEWPTIYDIRTRPKRISSPTGTRDMQMVNITLRVLYKPAVDALPVIHRMFGEDFDERILPSIVNETLKSIIAQYNASQLITQREDVSRKIRQNLEERAAEFNILLDDVSIVWSCLD